MRAPAPMDSRGVVDAVTFFRVKVAPASLLTRVNVPSPDTVNGSTAGTAVCVAAIAEPWVMIVRAFERSVMSPAVSVSPGLFSVMFVVRASTWVSEPMR